MKNSNVYKFALTLAASAVLAACSSGGGSKAPAGPTAAEKAAEAAQQAAAKAAEDKAKAAAELARQRALPQAVGFKVANKTNSDIGLTRKDQVKGRTSQADNATAMTVELEPSLDTVVVATPVLGKKTVLYVEDFDIVNDNGAGAAELKGVYLSQGTQTATKGAGVARTTTTNALGNVTKTDTKGEQDARVLIYDKAQKDYTGVSGRIKKAGVVSENSVAEVYGHKTVAAGKNNLPLEDKELKNVQYGRVTVALDSQNLTDSSIEKTFKEGIKLGDDFQTYVVPYAAFNNKVEFDKQGGGKEIKSSKEDHYFARGVNATTAASLSEFGLDKKDAAKLTYEGHAVTYGLDHKYHTEALKDAPNALGAAKATLVSGSHVKATVDLASRAVTGSIYNTWKVGKDNKDNTLVKFDGNLLANGEIKGNSELAYVANKDERRQGSFNASLFGNIEPKQTAEEAKYATELAGAVVSRNGDEGKKWGAVFGAVNTDTPDSYKPSNPINVATEGTKTGGSR